MSGKTLRYILEQMPKDSKIPFADITQKDDVNVCEKCYGKKYVWHFPDESDCHTEIPCPKCNS